MADERRLRIGPKIRQLVEKQREIAQLVDVRRAVSRAAHLQKQIGQHGREIRVADAARP